MSDQTPTQSAAHRLFAEGRILAGFLTDDRAAAIGQFMRAPASEQALVRQKLGLAEKTNREPIPHPNFRHVDEPEVIAALTLVASRCGGLPNLSNFVGFEWVEIAGIIAGHYVAAPMPLPGSAPRAGAGFSEIARYCITGSPVKIQDLIPLQTGGIISPEKLNVTLKGFNLNQQALNVIYAIEQPPAPVALLFVDDRLIAVRHQERLVALMEAGIKEALCLVHYGYGIEVFGHLPTIDPTLLSSQSPPRILDFTQDEMMVRISVQTPKTLLTFSQQTIDLTV
jgi:hypothetical protein